MQFGCPDTQTNRRQTLARKLTLIGGDVAGDQGNIQPASRLIECLKEWFGVRPWFDPDGFLSAGRSIEIEQQRCFLLRFQLACERMGAVCLDLFCVKGDQQDRPLRRGEEAWKQMGEFEQHGDCRSIIGRAWVAESSWIIAQSVIMRSHKQGRLSEPLIGARKGGKHTAPTNLVRNDRDTCLETRASERGQQNRVDGEDG